MTDIKERLRRFAKFMGMGEDALVVVALAEIERMDRAEARAIAESDKARQS